MKYLKLLLFAIPLLFFIGCSASEETEEMTEDSKYSTTTTTTTQETTNKPLTQETQYGQNITPTYIPTGPETPPPPPIKNEYVEPAEQKPAPKVEEKYVPPATPSYQYKVQVFASRSKLNADTQLKTLKSRLPKDQIAFVEYEGGLYKIRIGAFSAWEHAKSIKDLVFNLGYTDSFIVTEEKK